jgi:hypothetical protein
MTLVLFRTRRRDECSRLKAGVRRRVRKSRQKEAAGAADADAVLHLEEDIHNPLSLKLLVIAYRQMGDISESKHVGDTLADLNDPTLEQAIIVPAFRKCMQNGSCDSY